MRFKSGLRNEKAALNERLFYCLENQVCRGPDAASITCSRAFVHIFPRLVAKLTRLRNPSDLMAIESVETVDIWVAA